ncbi:MAG: hypothetical protein P4L53_17595 [Candidatus Obscuribacterales bacterium]|nr:hypothetical protein [Candidatus Obscuribacterales bacterium]
MNSNKKEEFEEIFNSTPPAELEVVCKLLAAGRMVKIFDRGGLATSVETLGTIYSDPTHVAAVKNVYRNIFIVVSEPVMRTGYGESVVYTTNNKGREFLEFCQNRLVAQPNSP